MGKSIKIVGSGPSGLTAAIWLARHGYEVDVYERNPGPGGRFHGDIQGLENWSGETDVLADMAAMGIELTFDYLPFAKLTLTNGLLSHEYKLKKSFCYFVKRGDVAGSLDRGLRQQAEAAGVTIHYRQAIPDEEADIIASGPRLKEIFAVDTGIVFSTSLPNMAIGILHDPSAWKGYGYLLVMNGYACLCVMLFDRFPKANACLEKTKSLIQQQIPLDIQNPRNVGGLGSFSVKPEWERNGRPLVGEASGLQDFLWGFGIRNAITTGWLAAESIIHGTSYARLAAERFSKRLRAGVVNRWLWEQASRGQYSSVINLLRMSPDPIRVFQSLYNFNPFQQLLYPLAKQQLRHRFPKLVW